MSYTEEGGGKRSPERVIITLGVQFFNDNNYMISGELSIQKPTTKANVISYKLTSIRQTFWSDACFITLTH